MITIYTYAIHVSTYICANTPIIAFVNETYMYITMMISLTVKMCVYNYFAPVTVIIM